MSLHPAVLERLSKLAADQRAAATAPPGPVLCVAPAGSGKTTTLVARICWLVAGGADPATVTAVTFNKRAAEELELRLTTALEPLAIGDRKPRVRTFHALGREILAEAGMSVANLLDRAEVLRRVRGRPLASAELRRLDDAFSRIKLDLGLDADALRQHGGVVPARTAIEPDIAAAFVAYEDALARADALDFDDLVRARSATASPRSISPREVAAALPEPARRRGAGRGQEPARVGGDAGRRGPQRVPRG